MTVLYFWNAALNIPFNNILYKQTTELPAVGRIENIMVGQASFTL